MDLRSTVLALLLAVAVAGCSSSDPGTPAGDRLPVYVDSVDVVQLESFPVQLLLHVEGNLPDPCTSLAWDVHPAAQEGDPIRVELYGVSDGSEACIAVLAPFEANIPLGPASGEVTILLNGEPLDPLSLP